MSDRITEFQNRPYSESFRDSTRRAAAATMKRTADDAEARGLSVKDAIRALERQAEVFKGSHYGVIYKAAAQAEIKARGWEDKPTHKNSQVCSEVSKC